MTFNTSWKWTALSTNYCIAVANMMKFQLSVWISEYIHFFVFISINKVQSGKELSTLMLIFPSYNHEQLLCSRTHSHILPLLFEIRLLRNYIANYWNGENGAVLLMMM
jgi:hypothetical protein